MIDRRFQLKLSAEIPVLFCYIGWAESYDGNELPRGGMAHLKSQSDNSDIGEGRAFLPQKGIFTCVIGRGSAPQQLHVVFVARDVRGSNEIKVVGVYAGASTELDGGWSFAHTRSALLIPVIRRPPLPGGWTGQGLRRWARHPTSKTHPNLLEFFDRLRSRLPGLAQNRSDNQFVHQVTDQTYWDISAVEGKLRRTLVAHRHREASLRNAKIKQAMKDNNGRLVCEVAGCAFDFYEKYGAIGSGYAHVHHLEPLSDAGKNGTQTRLDSLAIVCANCHAMIHRDGQCRNLRGLIPKREA